MCSFIQSRYPGLCMPFTSVRMLAVNALIKQPPKKFLHAMKNIFSASGFQIFRADLGMSALSSPSSPITPVFRAASKEGMLLLKG